MEMENPLLKDLLGDLRGRAMAAHEKRLARQANGHIVKSASKDRHVDSPYILKGILKSKQGGHPLSGRKTGTPGIRYYTVHRGFTVPKDDKTLRRQINADIVEKAVLDIVRGVLISATDLRDRIVNEVEEQRNGTAFKKTDLAKLESEKQKLTTQIEMTIDSLGPIGLGAAKRKLAELEAKLIAVTEMTATATTTTPGIEKPASVVADEIIAKMKSLGKGINKMPNKALRDLLGMLISRLEVDMENKSLEIELALPRWGELPAMCLEDRFARKCIYQAPLKIPLETAFCSYKRMGRDPCYDCRRKRAA
jgi:hypothetical protein